ncbi:MAG: 1,4-dihydroxy-6-naphthoate synthase [Ferruginibacter sp.]
MKISLGFSPCPNDTFIFDALVNHKIDTGGLAVDLFMEDVETLNRWALEEKLDVTKLSYGVLPLVLEHYIVLNSGSALGKGVGPLLITNENSKDQIVEDKLVAIPGEHTTAHMLFSLAYPQAKNKIFLRYDEIENFVLAGKGLGVIIHENRFTYAGKGLHKITDLGDFWEKETGNPIPLGGIVARRSLDTAIQCQVDQLIRESIEYAYHHHTETLSHFIKENAMEMSEAIMRSHINLYVNDYSINLGVSGKLAVEKLLAVYENGHPAAKKSSDAVFLSRNP